ncbi:MAG: hypothetical protein QM702_11235 [Rubrivivax sp.]
MKSLALLPPAALVGRQHVLPEDDRWLDEIVGQHTAADHAGIAVVVLGGGDADARAARAVHLFVEQAVGGGVDVPLQVAADQVVIVAEPIGLPRTRRIEQQPRALDGAAGDDHRPGAHLMLDCRRNRRSATPSTLPAASVVDALDHGAGDECAAAGAQRSRDHGVLRAVLGIDWGTEIRRRSRTRCRPRGRRAATLLMASGGA